MTPRLKLTLTGAQAARRAFMALGLIGVTACSQAAGPADVVTLDEARAAVDAGKALLIDVREPEEHAQGVAPGARLLPRSQLPQRLAEIPTDPSKPVYLICRSQNRSKALLQDLRQTGGYRHVRYVDGGMSGWAGRGWPLRLPGH
jgi:rhodanese-related sulfurtransferase